MTTIEHIAVPAVEASTAEEIAQQAALAEERFLASVRRRVAWQAEEAARLRALPAPPIGTFDVLDVGSLDRLLAGHTPGPRTAEWTAFLTELHDVSDDEGRLPEIVERLVRVVFAELL